MYLTLIPSALLDLGLQHYNVIQNEDLLHCHFHLLIRYGET